MAGGSRRPFVAFLAAVRRDMSRLGLLAFLLALPASAQTDNDTIRSASKPRFQVVDGDTVRFGSQFVRLFGIDAPKKEQTCDDGRWHPGPLGLRTSSQGAP
jgi:endonuclease YncB( thermonuclease family)